MRSPLLIEFVGFSGAGKSAIAKALSSKLADAGIPVSLNGEFLKAQRSESRLSLEHLSRKFHLGLFGPSDGVHAAVISRQIITLVLKTWWKEVVQSAQNQQSDTRREIPHVYQALRTIIRNNVTRFRASRSKCASILDEGSMNETWWYLLRLKPDATDFELVELAEGKLGAPTLLVYVFSDYASVHRRLLIRPRTPNTRHWLRTIARHDVLRANLLSSHEALLKLSLERQDLWIEKLYNSDDYAPEELSEQLAKRVIAILRAK